MPVIDDIREQQKKAMKEMGLKGKLSYFWYYYKIHTIVGIIVIICVISLIRQIVTSKDYGFYASFINASVVNPATSQTWAEEFTEYAGIDTDQYEVYIDDSILFSEEASSEYAMIDVQKLAAMIQAREVNAIVADTEIFEQYAQFEYFYRLEDFLTPEEIETYKDYFYYTDAATFDTGDTDTTYSAETAAAKVINHKDPSTMEQPVAVGICITDAEKIKESGFYSYLSDSNVTFQGYPSEVVLGIPVNMETPELTIRFIEYLNLKTSDSESGV